MTIMNYIVSYTWAFLVGVNFGLWQHNTSAGMFAWAFFNCAVGPVEDKVIRSQEVQLRAILSRFGGDRWQAQMYCLALAFAYPRLSEEYLRLAKELTV